MAAEHQRRLESQAPRENNSSIHNMTFVEDHPTREDDDVSENDDSSNTTALPANAVAVADAVFSNYELLELIIASLPPKDIRVVQKVAVSWNTMITRSITVRKARCVQPDMSEKALYPQILQVMRTQQDTCRLFRRRGLYRYMSYANNPVLVRPWLVHLRPPGVNATYYDIGGIDNAKGKHGADKYITEPPVEIVYIQVMAEHVERVNGVIYLTECSIRIRTGITVQHLIDARDALVGSLDGGLGRNSCVVRLGASAADGMLKPQRGGLRNMW